MSFAVLGWVGSLAYLFNHAYISYVRQWRRSIYYTGNFIAASCLIISSYMADSYQAVVVNSFWASISLLLMCSAPLHKIPMSRRLYYAGMLAFFGYLLVRLLQGANGDELVMLLGWSSTAVFGLAYLLFCCQKMSNPEYLFSNAYAALVLTPQLWIDGNYAVLFLEVCWFFISAYGLAKRWDDIHLID